MATLPTTLIVAGPSGVREAPLAPRAACEAVAVTEAITMGSATRPGPQAVLAPSTGLPRSWFSVSGWGWFTWKGFTGPEAAAAPAERAGGPVGSHHHIRPTSQGWQTTATRRTAPRDSVHPEPSCATAQGSANQHVPDTSADSDLFCVVDETKAVTRRSQVTCAGSQSLNQAMPGTCQARRAPAPPQGWHPRTPLAANNRHCSHIL